MKLGKIQKIHMDFLSRYDLEFVKAEDVSLRIFEKGEYLFRQGGQIDSIYILFSGKISVDVTASNGRTLLLAIYNSKSLLGDIEFFTDGLATSSALAMGQVFVRVIPFSKVRKTEENHSFLSILGFCLAKKLTHSVQNSSTNILNVSTAKVSSCILLTNENDIFEANLT